MWIKVHSPSPLPSSLPACTHQPAAQPSTLAHMLTYPCGVWRQEASGPRCGLVCTCLSCGMGWARLLLQPHVGCFSTMGVSSRFVGCFRAWRLGGVVYGVVATPDSNAVLARPCVSPHRNNRPYQSRYACMR